MPAPDAADRHRWFEEAALAHVLGGLSDPDSRVFRSHLLECAKCRARVGELRSMASDLADVERDERRDLAARASHAVDTKKRETTRGTPPQPPPPDGPRVGRVLVAVGLVVMLVLGGWNFFVRENLRRRDAQVIALEGLVDVLADGTRGYFVARTADVSAADAALGYDADRIAVVLDGVEEGERYILYQRADAVTGEVTGDGGAASPEGGTTVGAVTDPTGVGASGGEPGADPLDADVVGDPVQFVAADETIQMLVPRADGADGIVITRYTDEDAPSRDRVDGEPILTSVLAGGGSADPDPAES